MNLGLFGYLTVLVAVLALVFGACAYVYVQRLEDRTPAPLNEYLGARKAVLDKVRKQEPMSQVEVDHATQIISDCRSPLAYTMPAAAFSIGCFYVFGCLALLHGATPTARVFIGLIPMLGSTNLTIQLLRVARLKGRLQKVSLTQPEASDVVTRSLSG